MNVSIYIICLPERQILIKKERRRLSFDKNKKAGTRTKGRRDASMFLSRHSPEQKHEGGSEVATAINTIAFAAKCYQAEN